MKKPLRRVAMCVIAMGMACGWGLVAAAVDHGDVLCNLEIGSRSFRVVGYRKELTVEFLRWVPIEERPAVADDGWGVDLKFVRFWHGYEIGAGQWQRMTMVTVPLWVVTVGTLAAASWIAVRAVLPRFWNEQKKRGFEVQNAECGMRANPARVKRGEWSTEVRV